VPRSRHPRSVFVLGSPTFRSALLRGSVNPPVGGFYVITGIVRVDRVFQLWGGDSRDDGGRSYC